MNSNWSYSPETAKVGFDLCDLDLWPLTLTFCIDITFGISNNSWKFHDDTLRGTLWQRCDRETDRWTDRWTEVFFELLGRSLRDWSRSGGSYGNNTRVICCPAPGRPESAARGTSPPDNKSRGCCCRNSRPTVINPDYNMTKQRYITRIYDKKTFKITTKSSDVAYLPPLWRHASLLNDGSCSFTHPVAKGRSAWGTSPGT